LESALYIVATPIGNLNDISLRAIEVLKTCDLIAAEDTRHSQRLMQNLDIQTPMVALHEHNEFDRAESLIERVQNGEAVALISDAGTPLISDPGYWLVKRAAEHGVKVVPVPGPSAVIAALSASGVDCRRFLFEGFLPSKGKAKRTCLEQFADERRTTIFYESPHRILDTLQVLVELYPGRGVVIARELTKTFETILRGSTEEILSRVESDANQSRGEFVLILEGVEETGLSSEQEQYAKRMMDKLIGEMPPKRVAAVVSELTGVPKKQLYQYALDGKASD